MDGLCAAAACGARRRTCGSILTLPSDASLSLSPSQGACDLCNDVVDELLNLDVLDVTDYSPLCSRISDGAQRACTELTALPEANALLKTDPANACMHVGICPIDDVSDADTIALDGDLLVAVAADAEAEDSSYFASPDEFAPEPELLDETDAAEAKRASEAKDEDEDSESSAGFQTDPALLDADELAQIFSVEGDEGDSEDRILNVDSGEFPSDMLFLQDDGPLVKHSAVADASDDLEDEDDEDDEDEHLADAFLDEDDEVSDDEDEDEDEDDHTIDDEENDTGNVALSHDDESFLQEDGDEDDEDVEDEQDYAADDDEDLLFANEESAGFNELSDMESVLLSLDDEDEDADEEDDDEEDDDEDDEDDEDEDEDEEDEDETNAPVEPVEHRLVASMPDTPDAYAADDDVLVQGQVHEDSLFAPLHTSLAQGVNQKDTEDEMYADLDDADMAPEVDQTADMNQYLDMLLEKLDLTDE